MPPASLVLVTGVGGPSGVAATTALRTRGYRVLATDITPVATEADEFAVVAPGRRPEFIRDIDRLIAARGVTWFFPTVSEELVAAAAHAPALRARGVAVYIGDEESARACDDKWFTAKALARAGVPAPASAIGEGHEPAVRALGLPVLSKPRVGRGGRGVVVHDAFGAAAGPEAMWQAFLPGADYDVLLVIDPRPPYGVLASQVFHKTELKEGRVGNAVRIEPANDADVLAAAIAAAQALRVRGPCDIDVRRDARGAPKVLEINARIGAHTLRAPQIFDALTALFEQGSLGA